MTEIRFANVYVMGLFVGVQTARGLRVLLLRTESGHAHEHEPCLYVCTTSSKDPTLVEWVNGDATRLDGVEVELGWTPATAGATTYHTGVKRIPSPKQAAVSRDFDWLIDLKDHLGLPEAPVKGSLLEPVGPGNLDEVKQLLAARTRLTNGEISCCRLVEWGPGGARRWELFPVVLKNGDGFESAAASALELKTENPKEPNTGGAFEVELREFGASEPVDSWAFSKGADQHDTLNVFVTNNSVSQVGSEKVEHLNLYEKVFDVPTGWPDLYYDRSDPSSVLDRDVQPSCPALDHLAVRLEKKSGSEGVEMGVRSIFHPPICPGLGGGGG